MEEKLEFIEEYYCVIEIPLRYMYQAEFRNISAIFFSRKKMQIQYYKQGHQYDTIVLFTILCKQTKIRFKTLKFDLLCFI